MTDELDLDAIEAEALAMGRPPIGLTRFLAWKIEGPSKMLALVARVRELEAAFKAAAEVCERQRARITELESCPTLQSIDGED